MQFIISVKGNPKNVLRFIRMSGSSKISLPSFSEGGSCQVQYITYGESRGAISANYLQILSDLEIGCISHDKSLLSTTALEISICEYNAQSEYSSTAV